MSCGSTVSLNLGNLPYGGNIRCKFPQLMSNHIFGDRYIRIRLASVYLELEPHEVRKYCRSPRLGLNRHHFLAWNHSNNWKAGDGQSQTMKRLTWYGRKILRNDIGSWEEVSHYDGVLAKIHQGVHTFPDRARAQRSSSVHCVVGK